MKALTLTQPWATLVAVGEKRIETRGWPTRYRGPVAIHAAKGLADPVRTEDGLRAWMRFEPFASTLARHGYDVAEQLPRGAVVAVANLIDCLPMGSLRSAFTAPPKGQGDKVDFEVGEHERAFGNYESGRFAFFLDDVRKLDPVPLRGAQGLFDVPDDFANTLQLDVAGS